MLLFRWDCAHQRLNTSWNVALTSYAALAKGKTHRADHLPLLPSRKRCNKSKRIPHASWPAETDGLTILSSLPMTPVLPKPSAIRLLVLIWLYYCTKRIILRTLQVWLAGICVRLQIRCFNESGHGGMSTICLGGEWVAGKVERLRMRV